MTSPARPCERLCPASEGGCGRWKHHSRFASRRRTRPNRSVWIVWNRLCRDCEQKQRNLRKNEDRPAALIEGRAAAAATKAGVPKRFFIVNMNYRALIPVFRAMQTPEGLCVNCGHPFLNERDIQLEHREPPRHRQDWARLHARNIGVACGACNKSKGKKPYAQYLDEAEEARLSNQVDPEREIDHELYNGGYQLQMFQQREEPMTNPDLDPEIQDEPDVYDPPDVDPEAPPELDPDET